MTLTNALLARRSLIVFVLHQQQPLRLQLPQQPQQPPLQQPQQQQLLLQSLSAHG